ncbi:MAG: FtsH protease activity modulator HflK [Deltaproteobacteria bacterium]|nr:FtsH protease activity modulator HflK [Deltaproteobacteria bacterium]
MEWDTERPPSVKETINRFKSKFNLKLPGISIIIIIIVVIWILSGIYTVAPNEVGVMKRFGKFVYTTTPGVHYHFPYPIESVLKVKVDEVKKMEIGYMTVSMGPPARYRDIPEESLMLTGDENIVSIQFILQYKIKDAIKYLFNVRNVRETVKDAAEAAMREVVGKINIDEVLTVKKFQVQQDVKNLTQRILDSYKTGVLIQVVQLQDVHPPKSVIEAFRDVASAKEDKVKIINESEGYRNDILPKAKGGASRIVNEALAYKEAKIKGAKGDTSRFIQILKEYRKAKDITKTRLYIETMEEVLPSVKKIIIEDKTGKNVLPILPLEGMKGLPEKQIEEKR